MPTQAAVGTRAAVGFSEKTNSREAGIEVAKAAFEQLGTDSCDLVLLFATSKHDPTLLRDGVRSIVGSSVPLFGGSAVGVITNDNLGYEGYQVGAAMISSDTLKFQMFIERGLPDNEYQVGRALGEQIKAKASNSDSLLLLYDIVKRGMTDKGLNLNMATPLLKGMSEALGTWPRSAGGGTMGDMQWNPAYHWFGDSIEQQSAIALTFSGGGRLDTVIVHGAKPSSPYYTITKAEGNNVLELDGRPTAKVIAELLGPNSNTPWEGYPLFITLGVNQGEKFGDYSDDDYAVRLCMGVDKERGGLLMFGDDLQAGTEVQLMRRSIDFSYIEQRFADLMKRVGDRKPMMALYIDCAGRAGTYSGTEREEASEVQRVIGSRMPLLGWYVGCEIAKAGPFMQSHNWTGILSILSVS